MCLVSTELRRKRLQNQRELNATELPFQILNITDVVVVSVFMGSTHFATCSARLAHTFSLHPPEVFMSVYCCYFCRWYCLVGVATCYGLDGPVIEFWLGRDFPHPFILALGPTQPSVQWVLSLLPGDKATGV